MVGGRSGRPCADGAQRDMRMTGTPARKRRALFDWHFVPIEGRRAYRMACILFWSIVLYFVFQRYLVSFGVVAEQSMFPTLSDGSYFFVNRYIYHFVRPARGEIVILRSKTYEEYVKRVIALEGDTLLMRAGQVYVNGRALREPYVIGRTFPDAGPFRVEKDAYFVMGDNREESFDSRQFGSVPLKDIKGKIRPGTLFSFF